MNRRSKSSDRWLKEHFADPFVQRARSEGWRSRAVYKLEEIDRRERLLKPGQVWLAGMDVIDQPRALYLAELALEMAQGVLKPGGAALIKVFQGAGLRNSSARHGPGLARSSS
jgi:23S rRNA U2552 (ribose-2'-O)-methylase RlmE/FtsJ